MLPSPQLQPSHTPGDMSPLITTTSWWINQATEGSLHSRVHVELMKSYKLLRWKYSRLPILEACLDLFYFYLQCSSQSCLQGRDPRVQGRKET